MAPAKIRSAHARPRALTVAPAVLLAVVSIGLGVAPACTKHDGKDDEGKPSGIAPLPGAATAANAPAPPPMVPNAPLLPPPAPPPPEAAAAPPDPKSTITGEITLPAARRADVANGDVIFLTARRISDNPQARGALVAVKKTTAGTFPMSFTLSANDMMVPAGTFSGELTLSARVDKDGDPLTRQKGDVFGTIAKVKVGAHGLKLALDQLQKDEENLAGPGPADPHGDLPPGHP
jgi:hypothetical protein